MTRKTARNGPAKPPKPDAAPAKPATPDAAWKAAYAKALAKDWPATETATSDFSSLFTHLRGSGAQAFVFWGTGPSGVIAAKQYASSGLKIPRFMTPSQASKLWREHGALEFRECVGDDLKVRMGLPFPSGIKSRPDETVVFSWIEYKSKADRDRVNRLVMADARIAGLCDGKNMPFDDARMLYGGFKVIASA